MRKQQLVTGQIYHIVSRSIANFKIFNDDNDCNRILNLFQYFEVDNPPAKFSLFMSLKPVQDLGFQKYFYSLIKDQDKIVQIIAYCLMPTHIHLILKQLKENGISSYMRKILDSYTRYFNTLHKRKGPLWESRFKNVLVEKDEQLIHLTRYIHLNPTSAGLVKKPELWKYSSHLEYIRSDQTNPITDHDGLLEIKPKTYRKFVNDQKDYQRNLALIKKIIYPNL
jgi:putative transposase